MLELLRDKTFSAAWFRNYLAILVGSVIMAAGYVFFIVPHRIVPGGVYGLSIILHYFAGLPTGATAFVLNIPLLVWGIKELGPRFGVKTILGLALTSANIDLMTYFWGSRPISADVLMSSVFGGAAIGLGLGLIFKAKATTGGSDIVAKIMAKRTGAPVGRSLILIDAVVVLAGVVAFRDPTLALYAIVTIFTTGRVVDVVMEGLSYQKAAFIVSERHEEIRRTILKDLGRGGTLFSARGLFHGDDRPVILTALSRRELAVLEDHVRRIDPHAFVIVFDASAILGEGWRPMVDPTG